jgi:hypothetical protein
MSDVRKVSHYKQKCSVKQKNHVYRLENGVENLKRPTSEYTKKAVHFEAK